MDHCQNQAEAEQEESQNQWCRLNSKQTRLTASTWSKLREMEGTKENQVIKLSDRGFKGVLFSLTGLTAALKTSNIYNR